MKCELAGGLASLEVSASAPSLLQQTQHRLGANSEPTRCLMLANMALITGCTTSTPKQQKPLPSPEQAAKQQRNQR